MYCCSIRLFRIGFGISSIGLGYFYEGVLPSCLEGKRFNCLRHQDCQGLNGSSREERAGWSFGVGMHQMVYLSPGWSLCWAVNTSLDAKSHCDYLGLPVLKLDFVIHYWGNFDHAYCRFSNPPLQFLRSSWMPRPQERVHHYSLYVVSTNWSLHCQPSLWTVLLPHNSTAAHLGFCRNYYWAICAFSFVA